VTVLKPHSNTYWHQSWCSLWQPWIPSTKQGSNISFCNWILHSNLLIHQIITM